MKVLLFGRLADMTGKTVVETKTLNNISALKEHLLDVYPLLRNQQFRFAVNQETADDHVMLNEGDEIALLPPFAGG